MRRAVLAYTPVALLELALGITGNWLYDQLPTDNASQFWLSFGFAQILLLVLAIGVTIKLERARFIQSCEHFHAFIHRLRDLDIMSWPNDIHPRSDGSDLDLVSPANGYKLARALDAMAELLSLLVPGGTNVFTAIRERRADGSYHTLKYRGGNSNYDRQEKTQSLASTAPMIKRLIDSYNDGQDCVIITGQKSDEWIEMPNNRFKQDMSVMMGAVFRKVWLPGGHENEFPKDQRCLEWILCAGADRENVFRTWHKPIMKCFNDAFGILLNHLVRVQPQRHPAAVSITPQDNGKKTAPMMGAAQIPKKR